MTNWYISREALKRAVGITGLDKDSAVDRHLEAASRRIDRWTRRRFIPVTQTRLYPWPRRQSTSSTILWLDADLLVVTTLQTKAQDSSPATIAASDFFLEPNNARPDGTVGYDRIEIDLSSTAAFEAGDTPQRSISVLGSWGYDDETRSLGLVDDPSGITSSETTLIVKNGSLVTGVNVGDTLLIGSEQLFVIEKDFAALNPDAGGAILLDMAGNLASDKAVDLVTLDANHSVVAGETIRINTEQMFVLSVSTNDLIVLRAFNGFTLAAHTNNDAIFITRTLTIERGVNGTTAASISDNDAISKYEPPFDISQWCLAEAIGVGAQEGAGWGRMIGQGDGAREMSATGLTSLRKDMTTHYKRSRMAAI